MMGRAERIAYVRARIGGVFAGVAEARAEMLVRGPPLYVSWLSSLRARV
jgi:hypothetical protein